MAINLKKLVFHRVVKEAHSPDCDLQLSNAFKDSKAPVNVSFIQKLADSVLKSNGKREYAAIKPESDFSTYLKEFVESVPEEEDIFGNSDSFLDFSRKATAKFSEIIEKVSAAKGGYLVFAELIDSQRDCVFIFLVRDTLGEIFETTGKDIAIKTIPRAETEKLAVACRINLNAFQEDGADTLTIVSKKTDEVSDFFLKWVNSEDRKTNKQYTERLNELFKNIPIPLDKDGKHKSPDTINEQLYDIYASNSQKNIDLAVVSMQVFGDEDYLREWADENHYDLPTVFTPHAQTMKGLVEINSDADGIKIKAPIGKVRQQIISVSPDKESITIYSKELANEVYNQSRSRNVANDDNE